MTMTYKTIAGTVTRPGSDIGIRVRLSATPLTTSGMLTFEDDDRMSVGPETVETNSAGVIPTWKIPTNLDLGEVHWKITAERLDNAPGVPKKWTVKNAVTIEGTGTVQLKDLAEIDTITVDAQILVNLSDLVQDAEDARDDAETAELGAETARDDLLAQKGQPSGIAPLDGGTRVPQSNLPAHLTTAALDTATEDKVSGDIENFGTTLIGLAASKVFQNGTVNIGSLFAVSVPSDIKPHFEEALADFPGARRVVVPFGDDPWRLGSLWTPERAVHLDFEHGAQVELDMFTKALSLPANSRLTNAYFTSNYPGPASIADNADEPGGSQAYVYDARGLVFEDHCTIENLYMENSSSGLEFQGEHIYAKNVFLKDIRHYLGWASPIHAGGTPGGSSPMRHCRVENIRLENCDRGLEIEGGASFNTFMHGHLKNIGPNGYSGQPVSGPYGPYVDYTFILDVHSHVGEGACVGNVFKDFHLEDCYGGITAVRSNGSNDSDLPRDNVWEDITIEGRVGTTGYESIYIQGHGNRVRATLLTGSGVTSKMKVNYGTGNDNDIHIKRAQGYTLPLVTGLSTADSTKLKVERVSAPASGSGYLLDLDSPNTVLELDLRGSTGAGITGTSGYLNLDDSSDGSRGEVSYVVASGETFAQVIRLGGSPDVDLHLRGTNNEAAVPDVVTAGGVTRAKIRGNISRSASTVSVNLGGASSRCDVRGLNPTLGKVTDSGVNNRGSGQRLLISTIRDPALAAKAAKDCRTTPVAWGTANQGIWVEVPNIDGRLSLSRFRFQVDTQAGNYYAFVATRAGVVLWKTVTSVPAAGTPASVTMSTVAEVQPGDSIVLGIALSDATAAIAGIDLGTTGDDDQAIYALGKGAPAAGKVANLFTTNTAIGGTISLGTTHPDFIPLLTAIET